jgi:hypothetical protein
LGQAERIFQLEGRKTARAHAEFAHT